MFICQNHHRQLVPEGNGLILFFLPVLCNFFINNSIIYIHAHIDIYLGVEKNHLNQYFYIKLKSLKIVQG